MSLTFLHTAASHVARFEGVLRALAPQVRARHIVREDLLERSRRGSPYADDLRALLQKHAPHTGVILCTCSSLGAAAEALDGAFGARVVRVDRALAQEAVARGKNVRVLATLESTLSPTRALLEDEAARQGKEVRLECAVIKGAWAHFEAGDDAKYRRAVADAANTVSAWAEVIVLAQASMAEAEPLITAPTPVLSSPRLGVAAALELL